MPTEWPIVERASEFQVIRDALQVNSDIGGVILTGESGVGKTTLARLVTAELGGARWVAGTESARSIPLGVFAHLVGPSATSEPMIMLWPVPKTTLKFSSLIAEKDAACVLPIK